MRFRKTTVHQTGAWLAGVLLALAACAAARLNLRPLRPGEAPPPPARAGVAFAEAAESLDFPAETPDGWSDGQARFTGAVRLALDGRHDEAAAALQQLGETADDADLRKQCWDSLGEILFAANRWGDFLRHRAAYSAALADDLSLAEAWRGLPPETLALREAEPLPLAWSASGVPVVDVTVNGRRRRFWLDTGAGRTVLSSAAAAACGVAPLGPATTADTAAVTTVPVRPAVIDRLEAGPLVLEHHPALVIQQEHLEYRPGPSARPVRIDGLLGWSALRRMVVVLDGPGRRLHLRRQTEAPSAGARNLFWLGLPLVRAAAPDGRPLLLHLDSGAGRTSLTARGLAGLASGRSRPRQSALFVAGGLQIVESRDVDGAAFLLAGWRLEFPRLRAYADRTHLFYSLDGTLGSDVLRQAVTTIDAGRGRFILGDGQPTGDRRPVTGGADGKAGTPGESR